MFEGFDILTVVKGGFLFISLFEVVQIKLNKHAFFIMSNSKWASPNFVKKHYSIVS